MGTPIPRLGTVIKGFGSLVLTWVDYVNSTESAVFQLFLRSAVIVWRSRNYSSGFRST